MPIRALYTIKDSPIPLIADMYKKIIVPSISEQSQQAFLEMIAPLNYNFEATDSEEKSIFESWKEVKNQLVFTKGYSKIFASNQIAGLWVAYEALSRVLEKYPGPNFYASYMQVFTYNKTEFWLIEEDGHIVFCLPDEICCEE